MIEDWQYRPVRLNQHFFYLAGGRYNISGNAWKTRKMAKKKTPNSRRANSDERDVFLLRRSDEACSATQKLDFLRSHQERLMHLKDRGGYGNFIA
jgi:hypothetical protein